MRVSRFLFLFAMCFLVSADDLLYTCTREWPVPFRQCLILCQHGEFTFRHLPTFTLEEKANGTSCRRFFRLFRLSSSSNSTMRKPNDVCTQLTRERKVTKNVTT
uniref:Putative salivary kunitz domain protein n=1 Tax=Ixodes ricinus TaxID=34613 RepID=A0A0K8R6R8_IXORI